MYHIQSAMSISIMVTFFKKKKKTKNINQCKQHAIEGRTELLNLDHRLGDTSVGVAIFVVVLTCICYRYLVCCLSRVPLDVQDITRGSFISF